MIGDGYAEVHSSMGHPEDPHLVPVDYLLKREGRTWKICDLEIDAISVMANYSNQFRSRDQRRRLSGAGAHTPEEDTCARRVAGHQPLNCLQSRCPAVFGGRLPCTAVKRDLIGQVVVTSLDSGGDASPLVCNRSSLALRSLQIDRWSGKVAQLPFAQSLRIEPPGRESRAYVRIVFSFDFSDARRVARARFRRSSNIRGWPTASS